MNEKLFSKISTPAYVYHEEIIENNYQILADVIAPYAGLLYSMKANPQREVCRLLHSLGAGIEVASDGELQTALEAGVNPSEIVFTSPGKTHQELEFAVEKGIRYINVESVEEARLVNDIGRSKGQVIKILVRINPAVSFSNAKIKMSGVPSQFGIEEEEIQDAIRELQTLDFVQMAGFHIYMGTQMLLAEDIEKNTDYALNLFLGLTEQFQINAELFDVGGGFGVKYFDNERELDTEDLKLRLGTVFEKYKERLADIRVVFESGRFLTAQSGEFITKVLYVKKSKGTKYVICDGGSNFHSSAAFLGRFVRGNFPLSSYPKGEEQESTTVTGPLCTPLDVIGQKVAVNSKIAPGDYVIIHQSGAYGLTYSPIHFLSHKRAMEYMEKDGVLTPLS